MDDLFKRWAFVLLALRVLVDLTLAFTIYRQTGDPAPGVGFMLICSVFYHRQGSLRRGLGAPRTLRARP
jgi:hypothetical protein